MYIKINLKLLGIELLGYEGLKEWGLWGGRGLGRNSYFFYFLYGEYLVVVSIRF